MREFSIDRARGQENHWYYREWNRTECSRPAHVLNHRTWSDAAQKHPDLDLNLYAGWEKMFP